MRKRDTVMETMGCEQNWARMGVNAVIAPHAAADSNITFSPPTLFKTTQHTTSTMKAVLLKTLEAVVSNSYGYKIHTMYYFNLNESR